MSASERPTSTTVIARWESGFRTVVQARQFQLVVDEPETAGGEDTGPMPTEYLLASLSSCFAMALAFVCRKRNIELAPFTVRAEGTYDGPSFRSVQLVIEMDEPPDGIADLLERARRVCYVSNTLGRDPEIVVSLK